VVKEHGSGTRAFEALHNPFFSGSGSIEPRELAGWILQDGLDVRLNMQLHKIIYGPEERGV